MKAYFDRTEDGKYAVILVEELGKEFVYDLAELPAGSEVGSWFSATIVGDAIVELKLDAITTSAAKESADELMAKIRLKNKGSKFKKR